MMYPCKFDENTPTRLRDTVQTRHLHANADANADVICTKTIMPPSPLGGEHN